MILRGLKLFYGVLGFYVVWRGIIGLGDLSLDAASTGWLACRGQFVR